MANENSTFTFNPQAPIQQEVSLGTAPLRSGSVGGNIRAETIQYDSGSDGTRALSGLLNIAAEKLAPVARKMEEQAFLDGMTKAAAGQEMATIINDRPWYSKMFGDTPVVEGARAYKAKEAASKFTQVSTAKMDELRRMPPEAMSNYIREQFENFANTGDPATDRLIKNTIAQEGPNIVALQTREHVKYLNEEATNARLGAWDSTASAVQGMMQPGLVADPAILQARKEDYIASMAPAPGANLEQWEADVMKHIALTADQGNFHAIRAIEESGMLGALPLEQRLKLDTYIKNAEAKYISTKGMAGYQEALSGLFYEADQGKYTGEQMYLKLMEFNEDFMRKTGSSTPLFNPGQEVSKLTSARSAYNSLYQQEAKALVKAETQEQIEAQAVKMLMMGMNPAQVKALNPDVAITASEMDKLAFNVLRNSEPAQQLNLLRAWGAGDHDIPKVVRDDFHRMLNTASTEYVGSSFQAAVGIYQSLRDGGLGGPAASAKLFNAEQTNMMDEFLRMTQGMTDPKGLTQAMQTARDPVTKPVSLTPEVRKQAKKFADDRLGYGGFFGFFKTMPDPHARQLIDNVFAQQLVQRSGGTGQPTPLQVEQAWADVSQRIDVLGSYALRRQEGGEGQPRLVDSLRTTVAPELRLDLKDDDFSVAFDTTVESILDHFGGDKNNGVQLVREKDRNGVAYFSMMYLNEQGVPEFTGFSGEDVIANLNRIKRQADDNRTIRRTGEDGELTRGYKKSNEISQDFYDFSKPYKPTN